MRRFAILFAVYATVILAAPENNYPARWFSPVSPIGAPAWEILPQAAGPGEVILSKRNELGILSNFAATPFDFHGQRFASVEGLWQSMLYPEGPDDPRAKAAGVHWLHTRQEVTQMVAFEAKRAGDEALSNMKKMGVRWASFQGQRFEYWSPERGIHYELIRAAMGEKLRQNPKVKEVLLSTGNLKLLPDHHEEPGAPPEWHYYQIWTEIRGELRAKAAR